MILVTGGAGLLGNELITQLLSQQKKVRAIYNKTPLSILPNPNLEVVQCDILDVVALEEVMQNITQIFHCAAIVSFNPKQYKNMFLVNAEGTANVVNAAIDEGVKKIVHVSSVAALGKLNIKETINEGMNWTPETSNSGYAHSKYLAELEVWRGMGEGLEAVMVNPSIILGAGNWDEGSSKIFKLLYNEFPWYSNGVNGFVYVKDVAKAMIQLMDSNINGERFILNAENKSYADVFKMIATAFKKKLPNKVVTPFLSKIIWRWEALKYKITGKEPLVTKETATTALANTHYDNSKLTKYLPSFGYTNLEETIKQICEAFQQKLNR
jgi:dihydroflavonol-4-reductase